MNPQRIQRQRTRGWRTPLCTCGCGNPAIYVGRPSAYGNPFRVVEAPPWVQVIYPDGHIGAGFRGPERWSEARDRAVALYRSTVSLDRLHDIRVNLRGHDLTCWCPLDQPCHADVLIQLAKEETH